MLADILFPKATMLHIERVEPREAGVMMQLFARTTTAICPQCHQESARPHSYYYRSPADLPCIGLPVRLRIRVRRFFCGNDQCSKRTFAEQFRALLPPHARRTERLSTTLEQISFEVSAESGSRILSWFGIGASPDLLLRLVRAALEQEVTTPRVLGVDDWAKRKGQTYGTILIDLEAHQVVDVLSERSAEALVNWLQEHPGVEIISRDRGTDYIKGATTGAPDAVQVADRWHLLKNLRDALERLLREKPACLKAVAEKPETLKKEPSVQEIADLDDIADTKEEKEITDECTPSPTRAEKRKKMHRARKQERFDQVHDLHKQGFSNRDIGRLMKMSTRTISKYLAADSCPFYPEGVRRCGSKLDPFRDYLEKRWQAGVYNASQLWREINRQGFNGSRGLVAKWAAEERRLLPKTTKKGKRSSANPRPKPVIPWSARRTAWLLVKPKTEMEVKEQQALTRVLQADSTVAEAHRFVHTFQEMVRAEQPETLQDWVDEVTKSKIDALVSYANGINQDFAAVRNALTLPWSNGQTEGQVNRLKFIKRQMYGRANFDLLRRRVLGYPNGRCSQPFT